MKNIFKIFLAIVSGLMFFTSCDDTSEPLGLSVSATPANLTFTAKDASDQTVSVQADGDWVAVAPSWVTVTPNFGTGNATVVISVSNNLDEDNTIAAAREATVTFASGNDKISTVALSQEGDPKKQPAKISKISVAAFNALPDSDEATYELTGSISNILNTSYGNFYITDETGSVYVYGLLDKDGTPKTAFKKYDLQPGDFITLQGTRTNYYGTIEVVNAKYVSHKASLISATPTSVEVPVEAGTFEVALAVKGSNLAVKIDEASTSWLSMGTMTPDGDTTRIKFSYTKNDAMAPRTAKISFTSAKGTSSSTTSTTVKQAGNTPEVISIATAISNKQYCAVKGTITAICERGYILTDNTGSILCYYGSSFKSSNYKIGDVYLIVAQPAVFDFGPQMGTPDYEEKISSGKGKYTYPTAKSLDATTCEAMITATDGKNKTKDVTVTIEYVEMEGKLNVSGNYYNVTIDGTTKAIGSIYYPLSTIGLGDMSASKVKIYGYVTSISGGKYVNLVATSASKAE